MSGLFEKRTVLRFGVLLHCHLEISRIRRATSIVFSVCPFQCKNLLARRRDLHAGCALSSSRVPAFRADRVTRESVSASPITSSVRRLLSSLQINLSEFSFGSLSPSETLARTAVVNPLDKTSINCSLLLIIYVTLTVTDLFL